MTRVTVDTNVLISALVFQGLPGEFLALALAGSFQLITSPVLLDELNENSASSFYGRRPGPVRPAVNWRYSARSSAQSTILPSSRMILTMTASWNAPLQGEPKSSSVAIATC